MTTTLRRLILPLLALLLCQCAGYQLGSVKPSEMAHVQKIAIPTLTNQTLEPRLAAMVTSEIIKLFQLDGTYEITSIDQADAILYAEINEIGRGQFRSVRNNTLRTRELLSRLFVEYRVEDSLTGVELQNGKVNGETNTVLDENFQLSERQALAQASERMALELFSEVSEGW